MRILLDTDEVLVDFVGGVLKIRGWTRDRFEELHQFGKWDVCSTLGISQSQLWEPIGRAGESFWIHLRPTPWFSALVDVAAKVDPDFQIVSTPSDHPTSYAGKAEWVRREFGGTRRLTLTHDKTLLANPGHLLIDDRDETVQAFRNAGGLGIVFPTIHNLFYPFKDDPVSHVERTLYRTLQIYQAQRSESCTLK